MKTNDKWLDLVGYEDLYQIKPYAGAQMLVRSKITGKEFKISHKYTLTKDKKQISVSNKWLKERYRMKGV